MKLPTTRLAAHLQRQIAAHFFSDRANLLIAVPTGTYDEYNQALTTTTKVPIACSFTDVMLARDLEQWKDYVDIELVNASLRYTGPVPQKGWRVQLVSRFGGIPYRDEREYEIVAIQNRAVFGFVVALKVVTI